MSTELHQVTVWIPKKQWDLAVEITGGAPTNWLRQELLAGLLERLTPPNQGSPEQPPLFEADDAHKQRPERGTLWKLQQQTRCSRCRRELKVGVSGVIYTDPTRLKDDPLSGQKIPTRQVDCLDCRELLGFTYTSHG